MPADATSAFTGQSYKSAPTQVLCYALAAAFVVGVNAEIKGLLPGGIGAPLESALRWLPGFFLALTVLAFHRPWEGVTRSLLFLVLLAAILQSCLLSRSPERSTIEFVREMPGYLCVLAILAGTIDEDRYWTSLAAGLTAFCLLSLFVIVVAPEHAWMNYEWGRSQWRLRGIAPQAVSFAMVAGAATLVTAALFLIRRRAVWLLLAAINFGAFYLAGSRGPWLGLLPMLVILVSFFMARPFPLGRAVVFVAFGLGFPVAIAALYGVLHLASVDQLSDLATRLGPGRSSTLVERALIWDVGRQDIASHPWTGVGYKLGIQVDHYLSDADGYYPSLHAFFLAYWQNSGAFAALSLAAITFGTYGVNAFRCATEAEPGYALLRLGIMGYVFGCALFDAPFQLAVVLLLGLSAFGFTFRPR